MNLRGALLAAVLLGLCGLGLIVWIGSQLPAKPVAAAIATPPASTMILAAAHALRPGNLLKSDDIQPRETLVSRMPEGARDDTSEARAELVGAMVRRAMEPGEPLLAADLLRPGEHGFLAAVLRPGMRAATVGVDAVSGTAGLIWPGDRVDVIMTQVSDDQTLPASRRASARTVLGDVRVIAIDQQLMHGAVGSGTPQETAHTVTLEVTEPQAGRIALAARLGHLSFAVRSAEHGPDLPGAGPTTTWGGDISSALTDGRPAARIMRVYQGTADGKELRF